MKDLKLKFWRFFKDKWPYILLIALCLIFFYPVWFNKKIPLPLDALVGAYYPWLDYKWGYIVGVPFKNIALSDVFSQLYPWRVLSMESIRDGQWPLWNPYSLSGTPLLANWQSAPFYPLNIFMLIFGDLWGWTLMIITQPVLSLYFMYLYLRQIRLKITSSLIGSVVFTFSGFMVTYLEYGTSGQILLWLPLQLYLLEKHIRTKKNIFLVFFALTCFPILTGGFFQPAVYTLGLSFLYGLIRIWQTSQSKKKSIGVFFLFLIIGISTASIQLFPTLELYQYSIRLSDLNIYEYQFGLLPFKNFILLFAPDFFGNPATNNFWGTLAYQETTGYFGIASIVLVITAISKYRKNVYFLFFALVFIGSLLISFKNPLSQLIYQMNVPGISTGYASRALILTSFSASILAALGSQNLKSRRTLITSILVSLSLFSLFLLVFYHYQFSKTGSYSLLTSFFGIDGPLHLRTAFRNLVLSLGLIFIFSLLLYFIKSKKTLLIAVLILISFDLFRFGHKFTPFSPIQMANLSVPVIEFLQKNTGEYRIEREWGPLLPPNTWIYSRLYSPSGYDPLSIKSYARWYKIYQKEQLDELSQPINLEENRFTRYLETQSYQSTFFDLVGVKYLVALKRDREGIIDPGGQYLNSKIPEGKFKPVFEDGATVVLENLSVLPRVILYDKFLVEPNDLRAQEKLQNGINFRDELVINQPPSFTQHNITSSDSATIESYEPNKILIATQTQKPSFLMLTDTYFPGWNVFVDGKPSTIYTADGTFRAVEIPPGKHSIAFIYKPESFSFGLKISIISLAFLVITSAILGKKIYREDVKDTWLQS